MATGADIKLAGYFPGAIGRITALHGEYYYKHWEFDRSFEIQVGTELSAFIKQYDEKRDGFWTARVNGEFSGAIAVDGSLKDTEGLRIRWFIVNERCHGMGVGNLLLDTAMSHCRNRFPSGKVFLWTFKGLKAARRLYEFHGFRLVFEEEIAQWGAVIREQKFETKL